MKTTGNKHQAKKKSLLLIYSGNILLPLENLFKMISTVIARLQALSSS